MNVANHSAYSDCVGWWKFEDNGNNEISGGPAFTVNGNSNYEDK